ncbi:MAG TPA: DoxX family protein [Solirubrobacteraceae bacterium]|nr:DoxX family protein [Solirubrobacteraceae bacterium]
MKFGTLLLRGTIGGFFVGHGAQKLFGVAGGHGLKGTGQYFESIGLKPGIVHATAAGVGETAGGLGLVLGYRTPLAGAGVVATMATAIQRVHGKNGWNIQNGGFEYNAVLVAATLAVVEQGPGVLSLDALRGKQRSGPLWMLASLGLGLAGAAGAHVLAGGGTPSTSEATSTLADAVESAGAKVAEASQQASGAIKEASASSGASASAASLAGTGSANGSGAAHGENPVGSGAAGGAGATPTGQAAGAPFVEGIAEEQPPDAPVAEPES